MLATGKLGGKTEPICPDTFFINFMVSLGLVLFWSRYLRLGAGEDDDKEKDDDKEPIEMAGPTVCRHATSPLGVGAVCGLFSFPFFFFPLLLPS